MGTFASDSGFPLLCGTIHDNSGEGHDYKHLALKTKKQGNKAKHQDPEATLILPTVEKEKRKLKWQGIPCKTQPEKSQGSPEGDEIPEGYPTATGNETVGRKPWEMRKGKGLERKL